MPAPENPKYNNIMKKIVIYLFFITLISQSGNAQECGGGTLTLNIYTKNGSTVEYFDYEILPVSEKLLRENFLAKIAGSEEAQNIMENNIYQKGITITEDFSREIIEAGSELSTDLKQMISSDLKTGKVKSYLKFKTLELRKKLVLLKIKLKGKTIYVVGNFFGGCDREVSLIWNNKFGILN